MLACAHGSVEITELLLDSGANPALLNDDGDNCIDIAIQNGWYNIARMMTKFKPRKFLLFKIF